MDGTNLCPSAGQVYRTCTVRVAAGALDTGTLLWPRIRVPPLRTVASHRPDVLELTTCIWCQWLHWSDA